jgi:hypothetical protein
VKQVRAKQNKRRQSRAGGRRKRCRATEEPDLEGGHTNSSGESTSNPVSKVASPTVSFLFLSRVPRVDIRGLLVCV